MEKMVRYHQFEYGIAQEFQALIVLKAHIAVLVQVGTMNERLLKQALIIE